MDYMHDDCDTIRIGDKLPEMTLSAYEPVKDKTIKIKTDLYLEMSGRQYVKDDCLYVKVVVDTRDLNCI